MSRPFTRGFTLIEVMVATGLLVTIALGTAQLFSLAIRHNAGAKEQLLMSLAASQKLEQLSAAAIEGRLAVSPPDALDRLVDGFADAATEAGATYERRWLVALVPGYGGTALTIIVRVLSGAPGANPRDDLQLATICDVSARQ
jgi:prepilin-type N-terminal cleavage/methylation domain-containing protein